MKLDEKINWLTTLVEAETSDGPSFGTAFFYQRLGPPPESDNPDRQWRRIEDVWLVTNRHVALPDDEVPASFKFNLRRTAEKVVTWDPVVLDRTELLTRARFSRDRDVDVAIVDVTDLLRTDWPTDASFPVYHAMTTDQFVGQNKIDVDVGDDVLVVGYPQRFYDKVNLFPIVKSGIIASRWGAPFEDAPCFLIDARLFPGSSGSVVLSKPTNFVTHGGGTWQAKEKQFAFLGIYSGSMLGREPSVDLGEWKLFHLGEPFDLSGWEVTPKRGLDVGIVWYADVVEDIIENGVRYEGL